MIYDYEHSDNGFLDIFQDCNEDGDIGFSIDVDDTDVSLKEVCSSFEICGFGLLSFANKIPHLQDKIKFEIVTENDEGFIFMQLAPLLGLPGEDHKKELKELKNLLVWLKDKSFLYPNEKVRLVLDSVEKNAEFSLRTTNNELTNQLNLEMYEIINNSTSLNKWIENQKIGIINQKGELDDLCAQLNGYSLMSRKEKKDYLLLVKPEKKITLKKRRY